ncbi:MAG: 4-hydroxythreonine-4-phosphate dehydrogenase PdxA [Odoribacter splanchnicus]
MGSWLWDLMPDGLFSGVEFEKFDVILAMYHDQGMIPFKTIEVMKERCYWLDCLLYIPHGAWYGV